VSRLPISPTVNCTQGVVVSVSSAGSEAGRYVLQAGGNAVDAAVATAFALAVAWPEAGNIGGGGFVLVYPGHGAEPQFFDYRETAPAGVTAETFSKGRPDSNALVGVPGTVRGLELALQEAWTFAVEAVACAGDPSGAGGCFG